jgi:hypothetical protein
MMKLNIHSSSDIHSDTYCGDMESNKDKMKMIILYKSHYKQLLIGGCDGDITS